MDASTRNTGSLLILALSLFAGCDDATAPTALPSTSQGALMAAATAPPGPLVNIPTGGEPLRIWPYTDTNLDGTPQDPINLVFLGLSDPRNIRDALLAVNGNRAGPFAPFNCTWTDAIGGQQTSYEAAGGWTGSSIQLECGSYASFRFHVRLFPTPGGTLANAHVDLLIPGTTDHQVLSWELGEQLVTYDLARSGFLAAPPAQTGIINEAPTFSSIPTVIYNGLPASLRALTGGPLAGNVNTPVGIPTNGSATILRVTDAPTAGSTVQHFTINFGQIIPKPFCNAGNQYIRVDGPVRLGQTVEVSPSGEIKSLTYIEGELSVRAVNMATGQLGEPLMARVRDHYRTLNTDRRWSVFSTRHQVLVNPGSARQELRERLTLGSYADPQFHSDESCS